MSRVQLLVLAAAAVAVLHVVPAAAQSLTCYTCSTNVLTGQDTSNCLTVSSTSTNTTTGCMACTATATTSTSGVTAYTRGCQVFPPGSIPSCSTSTSAQITTSICSCLTNNCNSEGFPAVGTISCYSCSSVPYIDNGCGSVLNPNSVYVTVAQGCTACSKTSSSNAAGTQYTRACMQYQTTGDTCAGTLATPSCTNKCTTNLCNSAPKGLSSASFMALPISIIAAAFVLRDV